MKGFKVLSSAIIACTGLAACVVDPGPPPPPGPVVYAGGVAPDCPYGYYGYAPYGCAPYGYYGPEWFSGGVFIGAGPWHRGPAGFHGYVDNRFDPHNGYRGPMPHPGERPANHIDAAHFHGNEVHEGHWR
jgi:hypothetical protein